nr:MAG TPA: hypothetical protein [Caudoviricetes sp.]
MNNFNQNLLLSSQARGAKIIHIKINAKLI